MNSIIKQFKALLIVGLVVGSGWLIAVPAVHAAPCDLSAVNPAACGVPGATTKSFLGKNGLITQVILILVFAIGAVSVIMIVLGGLRYALSGGDAAGIKSAKETIIYAMVGLVIAILAGLIIEFTVSAIK